MTSLQLLFLVAEPHVFLSCTRKPHHHEVTSSPHTTKLCTGKTPYRACSTSSRDFNIVSPRQPTTESGNYQSRPPRLLPSTFPPSSALLRSPRELCQSHNKQGPTEHFTEHFQDTCFLLPSFSNETTSSSVSRPHTTLLRHHS